MLYLVGVIVTFIVLIIIDQKRINNSGRDFFNLREPFDDYNFIKELMFFLTSLIWPISLVFIGLFLLSSFIRGWIKNESDLS